MPTVSTYLNLPGTTEQAFEFYRTVFGTEFDAIMRMGDAPPAPDQPEMSDEQKQAIMHVSLPILAGHTLMGTDVPGAEIGNGVSIMLNADSKAEADDLFAELSEGSTETTPMFDAFWGDYYGDLTDRFGVRWMINVVGATGD